MGDIGSSGLTDVGDDEPHHHIDHQPGSAEYCQYDEEDSDQRRVDVEVLGQAATYPGQHALVSASIQLAWFFHSACPSRSPKTRVSSPPPPGQVGVQASCKMIFSIVSALVDRFFFI